MNVIRWQRPVLTPWSSFGRLSDLRAEIDRLFESPLNELTRTANLLSGWTPALDVFEDKDNFVVKAELPGMKKEDIDVRVENNILTIRGKKERKDEVKEDGYFRTERVYGAFSRSFSLPTTVEVSKIAAEYRDGVLTLRLPKAEEAKPRQIEVKIS